MKRTTIAFRLIRELNLEQQEFFFAVFILPA